MNKICIFGVYTGSSSYGIIRDASPKGDVIAYATIRINSVDGKPVIIAQHFCSGEHFVPHDMGITSDWKHDFYDELYPNGYELEYLGCFTQDELTDAWYNNLRDKLELTGQTEEKANTVFQ